MRRWIWNPSCLQLVTRWCAAALGSSRSPSEAASHHVPPDQNQTRRRGYYTPVFARPRVSEDGSSLYFTARPFLPAYIMGSMMRFSLEEMHSARMKELHAR